LKIEAPLNFWHAGNLSPALASRDPRQASFIDAEVDIDLRNCQFVRPAALLWCAVYPLLASLKGSKCRLLVPENVGTCVYLKSVGLFSVLQQAGVEVDDRQIWSRQDSQVIVPLTPFRQEDEVDKLANQALEALSLAGLGAANLYPLVTEIFAELALNAVQHSESAIGSFGLIQFYESDRGRRFVCTVADGGIGIRRSLERNPLLRNRVPYDWVAIELASRERISRTGDPTRGIGLYGVSEDMRKSGRELIIHSGLGALTINEEVESEAKRVSLFPGTLVFASIPT